MRQVLETPEFSQWLSSIRDTHTRIRLARRLERATRYLLGDTRSVGDGVFEMREDFGPGWRMYYVERGKFLIVMLGGGDKASQLRDIRKAKLLAKEL